MIRSLAAVALLLNGVAAVAATPVSPDDHEKSADSDTKLICKRFTETGSLVRGYRTCKTKREWQRERDSLRMVHSTNSCAKQAETGSC